MGSREPGEESRFVPVAGMRMVYQPACDGARKHPCPDCHFCQFCSDVRCQSCRSCGNRRKDPPAGKLSLCEQIELYERINSCERKTAPTP